MPTIWKREEVEENNAIVERWVKSLDVHLYVDDSGTQHWVTAELKEMTANGWEDKE